MKYEYKYAQPQIMTNHSAEIAKVLGHKKIQIKFPGFDFQEVLEPESTPCCE